MHTPRCLRHPHLWIRLTVLAAALLVLSVRPATADDGADAPTAERATAIARLWVQALNAGNRDRLEALVVPGRRHSWQTSNELALAAALRVTEWAVEQVTADDDGTVSVRIRWSAAFDGPAAIESLVAAVRDGHAQAGLAGDDLEAAVAAFRHAVTVQAQSFARDHTGPVQELLLEPHNGCLYVRSLAPPGPAAPDDPGGAPTPEAAAKGFLEALKADDIDRVGRLLHPGERHRLLEEGGAGLFRAIDIESFEILSVAADGPAWKVRYRWSVTVDTDAALESMIKAAAHLLDELGLSAEERVEAEKEVRRSLAETVQAMAREVTAPGHTMTIETIEGRCFVLDPFGQSEFGD